MTKGKIEYQQFRNVIMLMKKSMTKLIEIKSPVAIHETKS